eukprot:403370916
MSQGKYFCEQCNIAFQKPSKLKRHIANVHEEVRPYKCEDCGQTYKRKEHLTRHQSSVHNDNREIECPYKDSEGCLLKFPNRDQQRKHIQRKHEKRLFCDICFMKQFEDQNDYQEGLNLLNIIKSTEIQEDSQLDLSYNGSQYIQEFQVPIEPAQLNNQTQKLNNTPQKSKSSMSQFNKLKIFKHPAYFQKKSQLKKHMTEQHGEGYECVDHCGKKFAKKKLLNAHLARVKQQMKKKNAQIYNYKDDESVYEVRLKAQKSNATTYTNNRNNLDQEEEKKEQFSRQMSNYQDEQDSQNPYHNETENDFSNSMQLYNLNKRRRLDEHGNDLLIDRVGQESQSECSNIKDTLRQNSNLSGMDESQSITAALLAFDEQKSVFSVGDFLNLNGMMRRDSLNSRLELHSPRLNRQLMVCMNCGKIQGSSQQTKNFMRHLGKCKKRKPEEIEAKRQGSKKLKLKELFLNKDEMELIRPSSLIQSKE